MSWWRKTSPTDTGAHNIDDWVQIKSIWRKTSEQDAANSEASQNPWVVDGWLKIKSAWRLNSIVSGLSLDESSPTTYLDELDAPQYEPEGFTPPNPKLPISDQTSRLAILGIVGGGSYMLFELFSDIDLLGMGPWPGLLAFIGGLSTLIWRSARPEDDFGDGVEL